MIESITATHDCKHKTVMKVSQKKVLVEIAKVELKSEEAAVRAEYLISKF